MYACRVFQNIKYIYVYVYTFSVGEGGAGGEGGDGFFFCIFSLSDVFPNFSRLMWRYTLTELLA